MFCRWDEASEFPADMVRELGRMGLMGVIFPAEYGGSGLGYVEYVIAIEELSRVDGSIGIIVASHNSLCRQSYFSRRHRGAEQKYVPQAGQWRVAGRMGTYRARFWLGCRGRSLHRVRKGTDGC